MSYCRGEDNIVQVFDTKAETVLKQRQYKDLASIKGLHSLPNGLSHAIVDKNANLLVDDLLAKQVNKKTLKLKGEKVHKTYLL